MMCNNRNITCSHPFPAKQSPGTSPEPAPSQKLSCLSVTHGAPPRGTPSGFTVAGGAIFCLEEGGNEAAARCPMLAFFLYNNSFTRNNRCPEMPCLSPGRTLRVPGSILLLGTRQPQRRNTEAAAACCPPHHPFIPKGCP